MVSNTKIILFKNVLIFIIKLVRCIDMTSRIYEN